MQFRNGTGRDRVTTALLLLVLGALIEVIGTASGSAAIEPATGVSPSVWAADNGGMSISDSLGGAVGPMAEGNGQVYAAIGARLERVDVSDPDLPMTTGDSWQLAAVPEEVHIRGDVAYALIRGDLLQVIDLSAPETECCAHSTLFGRGLAMLNGYGFTLLNSWDPLAAYVGVVDLTNPLEPTVMPATSISGYGCDSLTLLGHYLYFDCSSPFAVQIYDVSNPVEPAKAGQIAITDDVIAMGSTGDLLIVLTADALFVYDASTPLAPSRLSTLALSRKPRRLSLNQERAAVVVEGGGVLLVDLSSPAAPRLVDELSVSGAAHVLLTETLTESAVLVGAGMSGLQVATLASDMTSSLRGKLETLGVGRIVADSSTVYAAEGSILRFVSRADSGEMRVVGQIQLPVEAADLAVRDGRVYVLGDAIGGETSLVVIDTDSGEPGVVGQLGLDSRSQFIGIFSDATVVLGDRTGLRVIDATDPSRPTEIAAFGEPTWGPWSVAADGLVYVVDPTFGIRVVRLEDPTQPEEIAALELELTRAHSPAIDGDRLFVLAEVASPSAALRSSTWSGEPRDNHAGQGQGKPQATPPAPARERLAIIDVGNPSNPSFMNAMTVATGWPWATSLSRIEAGPDQAYVLYDWASGYWWKGIARFRHDRAGGALSLPGPNVSDMAAVGEYLYVANREAGLVEIASPLGTLPPTSTSTASATPTSTPTVAATRTPEPLWLPFSEQP